MVRVRMLCTLVLASQERVCLTQKLWVAYVAALGVANEHSEVVADNDDMFSVFKMFCKSQDLNLAEMSTVGTEQGEKEYGFSDDMFELLLFALEDLKRSLKERGFNLMIRFGIAENVIEGIVKEIMSLYGGPLEFLFVVESTLHPAYHAVKRLLADFKPSDAASGPISPMDARRSRDDSDPNDIC
ncbi:hypothetical protein T459_01163 [Capsicum annuum]|uniref:Uncharacterized protein n=1 Tax=Capsicum annuum TaxID=4072 RepID=A0A2G3AGB3_CAPAN|nr:hypothetical protein T459_01163 [Capsicum annuum]